MLDIKCKISVTSLVALILQGRLHKAHTGNKAYAEESVFLSATSFSYGSSPLLMISVSCILVQLPSGVNDILNAKLAKCRSSVFNQVQPKH